PPCMSGKELEYIQDAFDTNWIAPYGPSLNAFEREMSRYIGVESALALSSGTAAVHLALRWLDVRQGDTVFCQDFTFIGSCDAILYEKCVPVFIDSENKSWNMSPVALENAFQWAQKNGTMPKAVIICDIYGESADWDKLLPICRRYGVPVIEDAAEAVGTAYKGKRCGSFGDVSVLSFNGNKILTTSGGGMVLSNNKLAIEKMHFWSTQAREPVIWYEHKEVGYNYRMSNICASIGRGQLEFLPAKLEKRRKIHSAYKNAVEGLPVRIKTTAEKGSSNHWLNLLCVDADKPTPAEIVTRLQNAQIESRPAWKPMHMQPLFADDLFVTDDKLYAHGADALNQTGVVDDYIFSHSLCLPSGDSLTDEQIAGIVNEIRAVFSDR
ncbi:MAG: DegT/DnrJ/EryC1/StrS family aminotransferase, partial [Bacillota bacterium]